MRSSERHLAKDSILRLGMRLGVFCLPLMLFLVLLEWLLASVPNSYSAKRDLLKELASEVETLIVGSSTANFGISPSHLAGSVFNLANNGETPYYTDRLLTQVVPELPKLKRVIFVAAPLTLFQKFQNGGSDDWLKYFYQFEWHIQPQRSEDRRDLRMWSRVALFHSSANFSKTISDSVQQFLQARWTGRKLIGIPGMDSRGWRTDNTESHDLGAKAATGIFNWYRSRFHEENLAENVALMEHSLGFLRGRNIEVVLVTTPVWQTFLDGMNTDLWLREFSAYNALSRKFGARHLCFLHPPPSLTAEDFRDSVHLNSRGAIRFTKILATELDRTGNSGGIR